MSHIRLSANPKASGSRNTSIGSASRGAVTPESAKAFTEREMAFQEKNTPTENLGGKSGVFEGHWVDRTAKADRRMLDLQRLRGVEGAQISLDAKEMLDYGKMKEAQAHEVRKYKFAAMYPRSGEPATEAKIMAMMPALEQKPMEAFDNRQAEDRAIKMLLFYGDVNGEDDFEFLMHILDAKYVLPMAPAWDSGGVWEEVAGSTAYSAHIAAVKAYKKFGNRFTPWGVGEVSDPFNVPNGTADLQLKAKGMILKRALPAFHDKTPEYCEMYVRDNFGYVDGYNVDSSLMAAADLPFDTKTVNDRFAAFKKRAEDAKLTGDLRA